MTEHCHFCHREFDRDGLFEVEVLACRQTHWSPDEYDAVLICQSCMDGEERDEDYERAAARYDGEGKDWR